MTPRVSIVIPVFNKLELTRRCLETLRAVTDWPDYELIVVDNASTDGTREFLLAEQDAGRLRALLHAENLGFGKACNAGAALARGDHVLLLNNDTEPHRGWLRALVETIERDPSIGMIGARLLYPDGTVQHAGMTFSERLHTYHVFRGAPGDHPPVLEPRDYPAVTGACVMLPRLLWQELGGLDESYRHYVEDVDLCMRVWEAGRRVHYCPESVVTHFEQQSAPSSGWADALVEDGWRRFHRRWSSRWPQPVRELSPVPLPEGLRAFRVLAFADELVAAPELLRSYGSRFDGADDATLVVYGARRTEEELVAQLLPTLAASGIDGDAAADILAVASHGDAEPRLVGGTHAILTRSLPEAPFADLPRFDDSSVDALRLAAESVWAEAA